MLEREPLPGPTPEEVMKSIGKYAVRINQVIRLNDSNEMISSGIERQPDGRMAFVTQDRFIRRPLMIPLSSGPFNPNHN